MKPRTLPSIEEVLSYADTMSNWGRWGAEDQRGTLNLVTAEKRRQAAALVVDGVSVSCAWPITTHLPGETLGKVVQYMTQSGDSFRPGEKGRGHWSGDFIGMEYHSFSITHIDSLCHFFWDGRMYNGFPANLVSTLEGAKAESVDVMAAEGVTTRGVLLDIARLRGVPWLDAGDPVLPEDLEEAERSQGVKVESGDLLFIRTGHLARHHEAGPLDLENGSPGPHVACVPWLRSRGVAVLGSDTGNDIIPNPYGDLPNPFHSISIPHLGLWLLDNANLEELAKVCDRSKRWEFQIIIAPLRLRYGTGSPVNPIAVF